MAEEFGIPFLGRAPIDPNFVLAIERNRGNQITEEENRAERSGTTIVDEYKHLALYDVFQGIVGKVVEGESAMEN